jgi:hypothetical protein
MHAVLEGPRRGSRWLTAMAVAMVLAVAALGAGAQSASAYTECAASWSLPSGGWSGWWSCGTTTRMQYMFADYNGAGTVPVCEQVQGYLGSGGFWNWQAISTICANNHAQSGDLSVNYWGYAKQARVKNDSAWTHTIWGKERDL